LLDSMVPIINVTGKKTSPFSIAKTPIFSLSVE
jgi:hypothetical protein